jgi:arylsulfatase A-like enzyme
MFDGPKDHGFDYSLTMPSGIQQAPLAYFENDRLSRWDAESNTFRYFESDEEARKYFKFKVVNGRTEESLNNIWYENYVMDNYDTAQAGPILIFKALEFIDRQVAEKPDQPFFMHFCIEAAHHPYTPPVDLSPDDPDNYMKPGKYPVNGKTPTERTDMVYESDLMTHCLIDKLKALGIYEDTILIYTSDNGTEANYSTWSDPKYVSFKWDDLGYGGDRFDKTDKGRTGQVKNPQGLTVDGRPLKGQKAYIAEGGHRVPLIIRMGRNVTEQQAAPGTVSQQLVGLHDLFATFCDLLGTPVPGNQAADSVSFADVLRGKRTDADHIRQWMEVQGMLPQGCEQRKVEEFAKTKGLTLKRRADGLVTGWEGKNAPSRSAMMQRMENETLGRAAYFQKDGKRWKLIFSSRQHELDQEIEPWELYELNSDPVEDHNLIGNPEHSSLIQSMLKSYKDNIQPEVNPPRLRGIN